MKTLYLILALVGAVVPYIFFTQHFASEDSVRPRRFRNGVVSESCCVWFHGGLADDLFDILGVHVPAT